MLFPNTEAKIVDDSGNEVAAEQPGELLIKGPNVTLGYWRNEKATEEMMTSDGWLKTGDIGVMKNDWFWIVDRKKVRQASLYLSCVHVDSRSAI